MSGLLSCVMGLPGLQFSSAALYTGVISLELFTFYVSVLLTFVTVSLNDREL
jgi:hypothetical protein